MYGSNIRFVSFRKMADSLNYQMFYYYSGADRLDYHSATYFRFHIDRRLAHSEVSWVISREQVVPQRICHFYFTFFVLLLFCIVSFSCGLPVAQINQEFRLRALSNQSNKQETLLFSCVLFFTVPKDCE